MPAHARFGIVLPKGKDGNYSFDKFNPQQNFDFSRVTNGQETAIKDARDSIAELEEKNRNLQSQIDSPKNVGQRNANRAAMQRNQEEIDAWKSILSRYDSQENAMDETAENEEQAAAEARENEIETATDMGDRIEVNDEGVGSPDVTTVGENVQPTVPETENEEEKNTDGITENDVKLSEEKDEFGNNFVEDENGNIDFGNIGEETGLPPAPIRLSNGEDIVDYEGKHHGYGLQHIEAQHGKQIRNAGYNSVIDFVSSIASGYNVIKKGDKRAGKDTYYIEITDNKNNTIIVELSNNGDYYTINTAGIFRKGYSKNKEVLWSLPAVGDNTNTDVTELTTASENSDESATDGSGNSPQSTSSETKDSAEDTENQEEEKEKEKGQSEDSGTEEENTEDEVSDETKALRDDISETMRSIEKEIAKMNNTVSKLATRYRNAPKVRDAINGFLKRLNEYGTDVPQDVQDEIDRLVEERDKAVGIIKENNAERSTGGRAGIIDPKDVDKDDYKTRLMIALSGDVLTNNIFAAEIESFVKRYFRIDAKGKLDKMNRGEMIDYVVDVIERESESSEGISINKAKEDAFNYFTDQISRNKK